METPLVQETEVRNEKRLKRPLLSSPSLHYLVMILSALAIFIEVHYLNVRHWKRLDLTKNQNYSLSDKTKKFLSSLKEPLEFMLLVPKNHPLYRDLRDLLEEYQTFYPKLKIQTVDFLRDPSKIAELKKGYKGLSAETALIATLGHRKKYLSLFDFQRDVTFYKGEEAITSALISLSQEKKKVLYFTRGHGEPGLSLTLNIGLSQATNLLEANNYQLKEFPLAKRAVPEDCALLVVVQPQNPFRREEERKILTYLKKGGRMLFLVDPENRPALKSLLKRYGLELLKGEVKDPRMNRDNNPLYVLVGDFSPHPFVESLRGFYSSHPGIRALKFTGASSDLKGEVLMQTSPQSIRVANNPLGEEAVQDKGPFGVAFLVTRQEKGKTKSQVLVIGDSHFALNGDYQGQIPKWGIDDGVNQDLLLNLVGGLTDQKHLLGLPKRPLVSRRMSLSTRDIKKIWWFAIIFLPGLSLFVCFSVWFLRKS